MSQLFHLMAVFRSYTVSVLYIISNWRLSHPKFKEPNQRCCVGLIRILRSAFNLSDESKLTDNRYAIPLFSQSLINAPSCDERPDDKKL